MPIYEYKCKSCGKINEFLVGVVQEKAEIACKHCGSKKLDKIFSRSFVSKGEYSGRPVSSQTCCGSDQPCDTPPCSDNGVCKR